MVDETNKTAEQGAPDESAADASGADDAAAKPVKRRVGWRGWLKRLGVMAMSLIVAAILAELAVTVIYGTQVRFPRRVVEAPWGLRYNDPGATYWHTSPDGRWRFRINRQGMRDDSDFAYEKPPGVLRIVSLGDSFTIGYEVDADQTFSAVLERELNDAGYNVEVLNAGVSGYSNAEAAAYLERELLKYEPDLVLVSFYSNDLTDNIRANLFRLDGDELVEHRKRYVPAGRLGNFLNSNWLFNTLSERSNAFSLIKERLTLMLKRQMVQQNMESLGEAGEDEQTDEAATNSDARPRDEAADYRNRLAAAIIRRMYDTAHEQGVPLIVQSIPHRVDYPDQKLIDAFPAASLDIAVDRPGFVFLPMKPRLDPHLGETQLYWNRSHRHWTPFAHEISGKAIAEAIIRTKMFDKSGD